MGDRIDSLTKKHGSQLRRTTQKTSRDRKKVLTNSWERVKLNELPLISGTHEIQKVEKNLKKVLDKLS